MHSGAALFRYRGLKLLGILNRPAGRDGARHPGVLFLHGFPGAEKNVDIQRRLMKMGIASFALHFAGAWGSEGEYTVSDLVSQARAGLRFLAGREFVDPARLAVFGFSMGGWAALNLAAREPRLRAAVAVSAVGGPEMITPRTADFIRRLSRPLRVRSARSLAADFKRAVAAQDPSRAVARLACPLLLVHGDADDVVPFEISRRLYAAAHPPKKLVTARGARHDYLDRREWLSRLASEWLAGRLRG